MARQQHTINQARISELLTSKGSESFCKGSDLGTARELLRELPISLPDDQGYLFTFEGKTLTIAPTRKTLLSYEVLDHSVIRGMRATGSAFILKLLIARTILEVVLEQSPVAVPRGAKPLSNIYAPVDLLNEYATLTNKAQTGKFTEADRKRQNDLLDLIGKEYAKREAGKERNEYKTETTTHYSRPEPIVSNGESRHWGSRGAG
jgi:hypothetical protein